MSKSARHKSRSQSRSRSRSQSRDKRRRSHSKGRRRSHSRDRRRSQSRDRRGTLSRHRSRSSRRSRSSSPTRSMSPSSRTRYYSKRNGLEMNHDRQQDWSGRESYERTRREKLERLRQEDLNWRPRGSQGNPGPSRGVPKRQSFFCRVCNVTSMSREMHDKHERSRKHLENAGREEDDLFSAAFQNSENNRGDDLHGRKGRRRSSDDSDIVIIEDQSARISDKKREATQSFEDKEEEVEQVEKEGNCTDCLRPMGDV